MNASQLIAYLNAIRVGDLDAIQSKLTRAREACEDLEQAALSDALREASQALARLDVKTYRKRLETVIARLGHVR